MLIANVPINTQKETAHKQTDEQIYEESLQFEVHTASCILGDVVFI